MAEFVLRPFPEFGKIDPAPVWLRCAHPASLSQSDAVHESHGTASKGSPGNAQIAHNPD
jgi:hypothetical protein